MDNIGYLKSSVTCERMSIDRSWRKFRKLVQSKILTSELLLKTGWTVWSGEAVPALALPEAFSF
jgi:hypothetical protein